jgi:hypothetical protein
MGSPRPLSAPRRWNYGQVSGMGTDRDGSLWVGTHSGVVLRVNPKTGHTEQTAKVPDLIFRAFEDASGRLFFETPHGLYLREAGAGNSAPHRIPAADPPGLRQAANRLMVRIGLGLATACCASKRASGRRQSSRDCPSRTEI